MIGMVIDIIFGLLPWVVGAYFLFPTAFKNIFAKVKEVNHHAHVEREKIRRQALLDEMKRLGYDREDMLPEDLNQLLALFKEEFPDLYEDKE